jgi:hypothetical protein
VEREEGDGGVRAVQRSPSSSRLGLGLSGGVVYEVFISLASPASVQPICHLPCNLFPKCDN